MRQKHFAALVPGLDRPIEPMRHQAYQPEDPSQINHVEQVNKLDNSLIDEASKAAFTLVRFTQLVAAFQEKIYTIK